MDKSEMIEKIGTIAEHAHPHIEKQKLREWKSGLYLAREEEDKATLHILRDGTLQQWLEFDSVISMVFWINLHFKNKWPWPEVPSGKPMIEKEQAV